MNIATLTSPKVILALALGTTLGACFSYGDVAGHCINQDGDAFCREKYGADDPRQFCVEGSCRPDLADGCSDEKPEELVCYSPCGGGRTADQFDDCEGVAEGTSSGTVGPGTSEHSTGATTEPTAGSHTGGATETGTTETNAGGCADSMECTDPLMPICENMACVACGDAATPDAACEAKDAAAPVCGDTGACVQCTPANAAACDGTTPVCDGGTSACVGCTFHEQCEATACDVATGACFDDACVVEVDGDGGADYMNVSDAISDGCVVIVHELDGAAFYPDFGVVGDKVAVLAAEGEHPQVQGLAGNPSLSVTANATVYVQGLKFSGNTGALGIDVDGSILYLERSQVVQNSGGGLLLTNGAEGHVRSSFIGGASDVPAVSVDAAVLDATYTTLGGIFDAPMLQCAGIVGVTIRNTILLSRAVTQDVSCPTATFSFSAAEQALAGEGNVMVDELDGPTADAWFVNYNAGDFHLTPGAGNTGEATFADVAQWNTGDPAVDIDGEPRPSIDGSPDVAGADVP